MVAGCEAKAKQEGWKMNIAIVDDGANLVAFVRMDGAYLGSGLIAQHKAMASLSTARSYQCCDCKTKS